MTEKLPEGSFAIPISFHLCPAVQQGLVQAALIPCCLELCNPVLIDSQSLVLELLELLDVILLDIPQLPSLLLWHLLGPVTLPSL